MIKKPPKIILKLIFIGSLVLVLGVTLVIFIKSFTKVKTETNAAMVNSQLIYCQELIVGQYRYSDVIALKKKAGLAKSYSIIKYTGIIRAGIKELKDITYDISQNGTEILVRIPPAEILGNEIINQEIFDEKQSIFVRITTQDIFEEIKKAKIQVEENLIADNLLDEAWHHAATTIEQFMYNLGFETVIVKIK